MSLLENQSYSKRLKFISIEDEEKILSFSIGINCNHEVNKDILLEIEKKINELVLTNYIKFEDHEKIKQMEKEQEKLRKQNEALQKKINSQQNKQLEQQRKYEEQMKKQQEKENKNQTQVQPEKPVKQGIRHLV